jgi:hypothetical protein
MPPRARELQENSPHVKLRALCKYQGTPLRPLRVLLWYVTTCPRRRQRVGQVVRAPESGAGAS